MAGQPRRFESGEQLLNLWKEFCAEIVDNEYCIAPTYTEFEKWLNATFKDTDKRTVYNALHKYFPEVKAQVEAIRADVISQGAMIGKYQSTMTIFALKNWCNWTDKIETKNESVVNVKDASEKLSDMFSNVKNE